MVWKAQQVLKPASCLNIWGFTLDLHTTIPELRGLATSYWWAHQVHGEAAAPSPPVQPRWNECIWVPGLSHARRKWNLSQLSCSPDVSCSSVQPRHSSEVKHGHKHSSLSLFLSPCTAAAQGKLHFTRLYGQSDRLHGSSNPGHKQHKPCKTDDGQAGWLKVSSVQFLLLYSKITLTRDDFSLNYIYVLSKVSRSFTATHMLRATAEHLQDQSKFLSSQAFIFLSSDNLHY